jgi:methyltransferase (TIGR00027 family)
MTTQAAKTTDGPAGIVALEQLFPVGHRLLEDDLILRIVPGNILFWAWLCSPAWLRNAMFSLHEKLVPGAWALFPCRKNFIKDKAADAVRDGVKAVVNLGAGLDTLVYRAPVLQDLPAWEVDQKVNVAIKRAGLERALGAVPKRVTQVAMDFDRQDLSEVLAAHGYSGDVPTFFVLEAVSQYLTRAGIESAFDFLAKAPAGSRLAFTYVKKSFLEGPGRRSTEAALQEDRAEEALALWTQPRRGRRVSGAVWLARAGTLGQHRGGCPVRSGHRTLDAVHGA